MSDVNRRDFLEKSAAVVAGTAMFYVILLGNNWTSSLEHEGLEALFRKFFGCPAAGDS